MKTFRLFRRNGVFYAEDPVTRKQKSLRTRDRAEAERLAFHGHEARRQPHLNLQIARGYLAGTNPDLTKRTWLDVMQHLESTGSASSQIRKNWATKMP